MLLLIKESFKHFCSNTKNPGWEGWKNAGKEKSSAMMGNSCGLLRINLLLQATQISFAIVKVTPAIHIGSTPGGMGIFQPGSYVYSTKAPSPLSPSSLISTPVFCSKSLQGLGPFPGSLALPETESPAALLGLCHGIKHCIRNLWPPPSEGSLFAPLCQF